MTPFVNSPSKDPRWLTKVIVVALHDESIARFGGLPGVRDEGLLESALERPRNLNVYQSDVAVPRFAASYGFGLARNHPFVDGNKRTALLSIAVFCALNGLSFEPEQADEVRTLTSLAAGEVSEEALADWVAASTSSLT